MTSQAERTATRGARGKTARDKIARNRVAARRKRLLIAAVSISLAALAVVALILVIPRPAPAPALAAGTNLLAGRRIPEHPHPLVLQVQLRQPVRDLHPGGVVRRGR